MSSTSPTGPASTTSSISANARWLSNVCPVAACVLRRADEQYSDQLVFKQNRNSEPRSRAGARAGGVGVEPVGSGLLSAREWALFVGTLIVFGVSAVILNALLYLSRLVPVWLSPLGLVGGLLLLTSAVVEMFAYGVDAPVALQLLGAAPIALQEMILAVLLIWKGFAAPSVVAANGASGPGYG